MNAMLPAIIEPEIIEGEFSEVPSRGAVVHGSAGRLVGAERRGWHKRGPLV